MVTKQEAITASEFHLDECRRIIGPRGGIVEHRTIWRRNGRTRVWVRSPDRFEVPIKWGLKRFAYLTDRNAHHYHTRETCPLEVEHVGDESLRRRS